MPKQNLLIIGATGWIGTYIAHEILSAKENFNRIAIFTSLSTLEKKSALLGDFKKQGVEIIIGDASNLTDIQKALEGITTLISAVGRAIISTQITWLPILLASSTVRRFYPSEYGTDIAYSPTSVHEKPHQAKLAVRKAISSLKIDEQKKEQIEKDGDGEGTVEGYLEYTYLVTGPYTGGFLSEGKGCWEAGGFDVKEKRACVLGDGKGRVSLTSERDVARFLLSSLLSPNKSLNRALCVNSFTTTPLSILSEFEQQTGGQKWDVQYTSFDRMRELEREAWEKGKGNAPLFTLRRIWGEGGTLYEERDNGVIGMENKEGLDDLKEAVRMAVEAQMGEGR